MGASGAFLQVKLIKDLITAVSYFLRSEYVSLCIENVKDIRLMPAYKYFIKGKFIWCFKIYQLLFKRMRFSGKIKTK